jgi:arginyl-tRNA synthetase
VITNTLQSAIQQALADLKIKLETAELTQPANDAFGDWSSNVVLGAVKLTDQFKNSRQLAQKIVENLKKSLKNNPDIADISLAGAGFINFTLSKTYWLTTLAKLTKSQALTDLIPQLNGKTIIVEYSSPNIAKPFTVGHLRSTIIGDAIANLYQALGWSVHRDNHIGDWGTQFGKLIYAIKTWGNKEEISQMVRPIKELVKLYVRFHQEATDNDSLENFGREWFKKLENGDSEARVIWQWCVELSWQEFDRIYTELKVTFTENNGRGFGESFFENRMDQILEILEEKLPQEQFEENGGYYGEGENGAKLIFFQDERLPSLMIVKKDGATLYVTRDLATDYFRLKNYHSPTLIVNEVGAEQSLYFKQLYKVEEMLGWYRPDQRVHVKHGLYRFKDKKMSTRKGDVIWLEDVINEAKERALAIAPDKPTTATQVAIGALKWNDLKSEAVHNLTFSWEEILSMKGNSGPYVQYAAVRAASVLTKAKLKLAVPPNYDFNPEELALIRQLDRFGPVVQKSAAEFAPHHLSLFLFELAQRFNTFYNRHPILTAKLAEQKNARLALTAVTRFILTEGLSLLGIETPEEM